MRDSRAPHSTRKQTMAFLVQDAWVRQESAARGLSVTRRRVLRVYERQRRESFESERAFQRFLRRSGLTELHLLWRIESDLLSQKLTVDVTDEARRVTAGDVDRFLAAHPRRSDRTKVRALLTARRQQRVLFRFIEDYRSRYRAITACAEGYIVAECGREL